MERMTSLLCNAGAGLPRSAIGCPKAWLPILVAGAAFLVDLNTPHGVADGFLYVAAVLVCVWVPGTQSALYTAFGLMLPMVLGFVLSPRGVALEVAVANRGIAMATIWLAAVAVWSNARIRESTLSALHQQQRSAERAARAERIALSDWLGQEISVELAMVDWRLNHLSHRARRGEGLRTEALVLRRAVQRAHQSLHGKAMRLRDAGPISRRGCPGRLWIPVGLIFALNAVEYFLPAHGYRFWRLNPYANLGAAVPITVTDTSSPIRIVSPTRRVEINISDASIKKAWSDLHSRDIVTSMARSPSYASVFHFAIIACRIT